MHGIHGGGGEFKRSIFSIVKIHNCTFGFILALSFVWGLSAITKPIVFLVLPSRCIWDGRVIISIGCDRSKATVCIYRNNKQYVFLIQCNTNLSTKCQLCLLICSIWKRNCLRIALEAWGGVVGRGIPNRASICILAILIRASGTTGRMPFITFRSKARW